MLDYSPNEIVIENDGVLDPNSMRLMGASTKRGDSSMRGHFGSGFKYALAYMLREGVEFSVYAGGRKIAVDVQDTELRGQTFGVICVDGQPTSMTTELGPQWAAPQAFRELYCNAQDEGAIDPVRLVSKYVPEADKTAIVIKNTGEMANIITNFKEYFAGNTPTVYSKDGNRIIEKASKSTLRVFRKGVLVRAQEDSDSLFDYDLDALEITEDRTPKYEWVWRQKVLELIYSCTDAGIISKMLSTEGSELSLALDSYVTTHYTSLSDAWQSVVGNRAIATQAQVVFTESLNKTITGEVLVVNPKLYDDLTARFPEMRTLLSGKDSVGYAEEITTKGQQDLIDRVLVKLSKANINISYPIKVVKFMDDKIMGMADRVGSCILISSKVFYQGDQVVMETLLEEWVHIEFNVDDETRSMQDVLLRLLSQKVMEG